MIKAVVFDMDDTLYPESAYVRSGFRAVANWAADTYQWPADDSYTMLTTLFDQGVRGDTFNHWLAAYGHDTPDVVAECVRVYRDHQPTLTPYEDIPALLRDLKPLYKIGLVSDGFLMAQQAKFAALALVDWFDVLVFSDQWGRDAWKPSTRPFEEVLRLLGVTGPQAVYIGDNPTKDFFGARQVGMKTLWYRHEGGVYADKQPPTDAHHPDGILMSYQDLQHTLEQFASPF